MKRLERLAHELRQPLTAILSNAQAAQRLLRAGGTDTAEVHEILEDIVVCDKRAAGILRRLEERLKEIAPSAGGPQRGTQGDKP